MAGTDRRQGLLTAVAMTASAVMIAQHIAGKATRDALFLTYFDVSRLPLMMMVSAGISVVLVLGMSRLLAHLGPARVIPPLYLASAGLLAGQWLLAETSPQVAAAALYLHVAALNAILLSGFWSVINERFDPYAAKAVIARLTAAATFGGLVGGLVSKGASELVGTRGVILVLSVMHLVCGLAVSVLARGGQAAAVTAASEPPGSLLAPLRRSRLIRRMALLCLFVATTAAVLDYLLKAEAVASFGEDELISFFSYFYVAVGLGTFLVQSLVGKRALGWLGLGGAMAAWPLVILVTGATALVARSIATVVLMRASANLLYNSFFRSGFELLYTPIAPADKRSGKVLIDVGADRAGDMLGGLLILGLLLVPLVGDDALFVLALLLAASCLLLILLLNRDYVRQLADNLRSGELDADAIEVADATTARTIATTRTTIQRDQLLRDIEAFQARETQARPAATEAPAQAAEPLDAAGDATVAAIAALRSDDVEIIHRILASRPLTAALVPHVVPLLAREDCLREALRALRKATDRHTGQLVDALLQPMQDPLIRRRLPLALSHAAGPLAEAGLFAGLDDADWNVRFRCAVALNTMRRRNATLRLDRRRLLHAARRETLALEESPTGNDMTARGNQLDLVFLLLGAAYNPETQALCRDAVSGEDRSARGTALEYLENRLPGELWVLLKPHLVDAPPPSGRRRSPAELRRALAEARERQRSGETSRVEASDGATD